MGDGSGDPIVTGRESRQLSTAVLVYVLVLVALQLFLFTVAVEGLLADDPGLSWAATGVSGILAAGAVLFYRYVPRE